MSEVVSVEPDWRQMFGFATHLIRDADNQARDLKKQIADQKGEIAALKRQ